MKKAEKVDRRALESELKRSKEMFTTLLDSLNASVYVADIKTNEVLYLNKYSRKIFGDVVGKLCWQVLQTGQTGPCDFCTNDKLLTPEGKPKGIYRWEFKNTVNGKWYDIHDRAIEWVDGRIVRLEIATDITDHKNAEDSLSVSEEKYRLLFTGNQDAIVIVDAETKRIIDVNDSALRLYGYSRKEILKLCGPDLSAEPEKSTSAIEEISEQTNQRILYHTRLHRKRDGTVFPVEISSGNYLLNNRMVISAIIRDITERKKWEEELRETKAILQAAMDQSPVGIAIADAPDGRLRYVNDAGLLIRGDDRASVVDGVGINQYVSSWQILDFDGNPLRADEVPLARAILFGESCNREFIVRRTDTDDRIVFASAAPIKDRTGKVVSGIVVFTDITDRKKAEQELKASEERYRDLFENASDAIFIVDNNYNYIDVNKKATDLLRYTKEELLKTNILDHIPPDQVQLSKDTLKKLYSDGSYKDFVGKICTKDGSWLDVEVSSSAIKEGDRVVGSRDILRDITERKNLEEQLRQSQKMELVGQLAGGMAHDFNNIMAVIMNYGYILKNKLDDDEHKEIVLHMLESTNKAAKLISDLLTFSRRQVLETIPIKLNEIIKRVEKLISRIIGEHIELNTILTEKDPVVIADSAQLEQVLMNLFSNARDAMPDGGTLTIETEEIEMDDQYIRTHGYGESGRYVLLSVTDTGKGMDKETRDKIFEPFYTTKGVGKGTGLGLAMVYGIIKQHNGFINVYSELGKGTTFKIYLPVTGQEAVEVRPTVSKTITKGAETVLLAEDDAELRGVTKKLLEEYGYKVIEAVNGEDAVAKFNENKERIQLLVFDSIMPKKSGKKAYDKIRKGSPDIKVLFMSGYTEDSIVKNGVLKEGLNFISKPVVPNELFKKIREILDK